MLERHETEAHAIGGRDIVELGDALVLIDPSNPDPFWNRMVSVRWPSDSNAFDRRLAEAIALFGGYARRPHVWPTVTGDRPADLVERLLANGFEDTGGGIVMARPLTNEDRGLDADLEDGRLQLERVASANDARSVEEAASVLATSFTSHGESDSDVDRRDDSEIGATAAAARSDLARVLADPRVVLVVARVDGAAAAVAKVTGGSGLAYVSSVATHPSYRGRGLGALVTRLALVEGVRSGASLAYLGVFEGNAAARRLYERLGFRAVGRPAADLLLVG